jgi:hypothetical protein
MAEQAGSIEAKKGVVDILSLYIDRFEGIRPLDPEHPLAVKFPNVKSMNIDARSLMPGHNSQKGHIIQVTLWQTVGLLRKKVAEAYNLQINEFKLLLKGAVADPEEDHKHMKDFVAGTPLSLVIIKPNTHYDKT